MSKEMIRKKDDKLLCHLFSHLFSCISMLKYYRIDKLGEDAMRKLFTPDWYVQSYRHLDVNRLVQQGIRVLVCDIDNTLVPHDVADPDEAVIAFVHTVKQSGLKMVLISNNVKERVDRFAAKLDVATYPFARKPLKMTYVKMMREMNCSPHQVAVLGDQLLTDMLGANRLGCYTILTQPLAQRDLRCTKINRIFENMVFSVLKAQGKLRKGEFDE